MTAVPRIPLDRTKRLERARSDDVKHDLASLSDEALQDRLEAALRRAERSDPFVIWPFGHLAVRSPIRYRRLDRFLAAGASMSGEPSWLVLLFAWLVSAKKHEALLRQDAMADRHLSLCEIRDIQDELRRRIVQRKGMTP